MQEITIRKSKELHSSERFKINNLGNQLVTRSMKERLHRHDYIFLMVLEEATGTHHIDFNSYPVTSNTVFVIRPGQVHELFLNQGSKGYLLTFDSQFYFDKHTQNSNLLSTVSRHNHYSLSSQNFSKVLSSCENILYEFTSKKAGYEKAAKAYLDILFIELKRDILNNNTPTNENTSYEQELLEKFVQLLESSVCPNKQVTQYSDMLNITPYKLNSITKKLQGRTSSQLITEQIILEAKRLLLATSNQINEVAYKLCFDDPAYFVRYFKKNTGFTPKAFRQNFS